MSNRFSLVLGTPINKTKTTSRQVLTSSQVFTTNQMSTVTTPLNRQVGSISGILNAPKSNSKTCGCSCGR